MDIGDLILEGIMEGVTETFESDATREAYVELDNTEWGRKFTPNYFDLPSGRHHKYLSTRLSDILTEEGTRIVFVGPRDCGKSVHMSFLLPLRAICESRARYIVIISDTDKQAKKFLEGIKWELEHNVLLAQAYPAACGKGDPWTKHDLRTRNKIRLEAFGMKSGIRGTRDQDARPDLVIIDDPEGDASSYSVTIGWALKCEDRVMHGLRVRLPRRLLSRCFLDCEHRE